jgi:hypothetical protein
MSLLQKLEENASVQIEGNKNLKNNEKKIKNIKIKQKKPKLEEKVITLKKTTKRKEKKHK